MKKFILLFLVLPLALGSFRSSDVSEFKIGDMAPLRDYNMESCNGTPLSVETAMQKNGLVVVFSCNTCPFVVGNEEFPGWEKQYNGLAELAKSNNIGFILVNSNEAKRDLEDSFEAMNKHAEENAYTMPYLIDYNSELANAYGAKTTPHVYVLNPEFNLVYKGSIDNSWDTNRKKDEAYLRNALHELIEKPDISVPESSPKGCSIKRIK